ncbi:MAG: signal recognition particle-docking protein FtsY [Rickettsiales bacterium]|jgi:fused signal recognition particle receptor|nr:signal recognition particle-docking protein FtsY [Rickettsiales bacterium]
MSLFTKIFGRNKPDAISAEQLEEILIAGDVAPIDATRIRIARKVRGENFDAMRDSLIVEISAILKPLERKLELPERAVIMMAGVNGAGKTSTIGKLANLWKGRKIVIGAGDTFRAAATEQLAEFARLTGAGFISGNNADPASVAYKTLEQDFDIAIIDTAGRLGTRGDLMDELPKIIRVMKKLISDAPHESWLVLDGTTGQNMTQQIRAFGEKIPLTGLVITKLDGTARAGAIISYALAEKSPLPIMFTTNGEGLSDITAFDAEGFARNLVG